MADATKSAANPNGLDVVYWIAPENGAKKAATPHVFHICQGVSPLRGKTVNHGSVTRGLCGERHPHHQADSDGAEAVRFRRATRIRPPAAASGLTPELAASTAGALLAADVDPDERFGRVAALDQQQHARCGRPCAPHRPPATTCAGVVTGWLLTDMIRSPRWRPFSAASLLGSTAVMITPRAVAGRLAARASSGVSGASDRPSACCGATAASLAPFGVAVVAAADLAPALPRSGAGRPSR